MHLILAIVVGILYACGLYLMMRRSVLKLIIGLGLLGHAANLLIFTAGRVVPGAVPAIPQGATFPAGPIADPVPQALILTAIVIGFGVQAFAILLVRRLAERSKTDDVGDLTTTEQLEITGDSRKGAA
jgi:multicomponent Na+:H+ antiporter subunit C